MSDLHKRNTDAMISHSREVGKQLHELKQQVVLLNSKVASLTSEVASIKKQQVMRAVADQFGSTGHGGTA